MTHPNHPTPADSDTHEVGDVFSVEADPSDDETANEYHEIELHDPPGRIGYAYTCNRCGQWFVSTLNFERTTCIPAEHL